LNAKIATAHMLPAAYLQFIPEIKPARQSVIVEFNLHLSLRPSLGPLLPAKMAGDRPQSRIKKNGIPYWFVST